MAITRIKICGITRPEDALSAIASGADAIGLVFYAKSPRAVSLEQAALIAAAVPPFVSIVALFVNESVEQVNCVLNTIAVDVIQFHGDETADFCEQFNRPFIKAIRVRPELNLEAACRPYAAARGILLDAWQDGVPGGTGKQFDWQLARLELSLPVILAGGLNPGNVVEAIKMLHPAAVDVSGGVELSPGIKDAVKIREFIAAVKTAEQQ